MHWILGVTAFLYIDCIYIIIIYYSQTILLSLVFPFPLPSLSLFPSEKSSHTFSNSSLKKYQ
jgi:hypothetical protein